MKEELSNGAAAGSSFMGLPTKRAATSKRRVFSDETRRALAEEAMGGASLTAVAKRHGVSETTVHYWKKKLGAYVVPVAAKKSGDYDELLALISIVAEMDKLTPQKRVLVMNFLRERFG